VYVSIGIEPHLSSHLNLPPVRAHDLGDKGLNVEDGLLSLLHPVLLRVGYPEMSNEFNATCSIITPSHPYVKGGMPDDLGLEGGLDLVR
jgi:hypothetical protein